MVGGSQLLTYFLTSPTRFYISGAYPSYTNGSEAASIFVFLLLGDEVSHISCWLYAHAVDARLFAFVDPRSGHWLTPIPNIACI